VKLTSVKLTYTSDDDLYQAEVLVPLTRQLLDQL
jgi:hypothetical protein